MTQARARRPWLALFFGVLNHGAFLAAVSVIAIGLHEGMRQPWLPWERTAAPHASVGHLAAFAWDLFLLAQFPLLHSWLMTRSGGRWLGRLAPRGTERALAPTLFTLVAALQLLLAFVAWQPLAATSWRPHGVTAVGWELANVGAWLFLGKALFDGGLGLQTGWIGWTALFRGGVPRFPGLPQKGLFARSRQPIYLGFALVLWSGPVWTLDHLLVAVAWSVYCLVGPLHKERRFEARFGDAFRQYRAAVPYFLPRKLRP